MTLTDNGDGTWTELSADSYGSWVTCWQCEPPAPGIRYRVLDDEWNSDATKRTIRRIELA